MSEFDAVCFDLDSTLCVSGQSDAEIHEAVFERCGVDPFFSPADVRAVDSAALRTAETDREFYEFLYREVCETVGGDPAHAPDSPRRPSTSSTPPPSPSARAPARRSTTSPSVTTWG